MAYCFISAISFKNLLHACKMLKVIYPEKDNQLTTAKFTHINLVGCRHRQSRQLPKAASCQRRKRVLRAGGH